MKHGDGECVGVILFAYLHRHICCASNQHLLLFLSAWDVFVMYTKVRVGLCCDKNGVPKIFYTQIVSSFYSIILFLFGIFFSPSPPSPFSSYSSFSFSGCSQYLIFAHIISLSSMHTPAARCPYFAPSECSRYVCVFIVYVSVCVSSICVNSATFISFNAIHVRCTFLNTYSVRDIVQAYDLSSRDVKHARSILTPRQFHFMPAHTHICCD